MMLSTPDYSNLTDWWRPPNAQRCRGFPYRKTSFVRSAAPRQPRQRTAGDSGSVARVQNGWYGAAAGRAGGGCHQDYRRGHRPSHRNRHSHRVCRQGRAGTVARPAGRSAVAGGMQRVPKTDVVAQRCQRTRRHHPKVVGRRQSAMPTHYFTGRCLMADIIYDRLSGFPPEQGERAKDMGDGTFAIVGLAVAGYPPLLSLSNVSAIGPGLVMDNVGVRNNHSVVVVLTGTSTASNGIVQLQGSQDGVNWINLLPATN